ncbi:putative aquaporin 3 [Clavulina sp. PMI_390]|nr:putative aquaporin 3 [Clavulina sp. PMI_390]
MILLIVGAGVDCQVTLSASSAVASSQRGSYLSCSLGWAAGAACGVWVAGPSGGHINPAVTLVMAVFRGFSWKKVPVYVLAQTLGACAGALIVYLNYYTAIGLVDPEKTIATASLFSTYGLQYVPSGVCWFNEFIGTALLLMVVFATAQKSPGAPPAGLVPLVIFIALTAIGTSLGMQTGYALNPARDFGPRLALLMVGYSPKLLFRFRSLYWLWCPIIAPIVGALTGATLYDTFLADSSEKNSPLNHPNREASKYPEDFKIVDIGTMV